MERTVDFWLRAISSIRGHALRYSLTCLGIVWGIFTLTFLQAATDGFDGHFSAQITKVGARLIAMFPGPIESSQLGQRGMRTLALEERDLDSIRKVSMVAAATPNLRVGEQIVRTRLGAESRTKLLAVFGVSPEAEQVRNFEIASGRFITPDDVEKELRVAFLGWQAKQRLFGSGPAIGKGLRIDSIPFRVVGISQPKGSQMLDFGADDDEQVLIPYTTAQRWFTKSESVGAIFAQVDEEEKSGPALELSSLLLALNHRFGPEASQSVDTFDIEEGLRIVRLLGLGLSVFFLATSVITLFVGAIGVMNILIVVVSERTREIGLRKALGASSREIFRELLAESLIITAVAGFVGALLGAGAVYLIAASIPLDPLTGDPITAPPQLLPSTFAVVVLTLMGVSLLAGTLPALRGMAIEPSQALRKL